jgi:hypothetical protein
MPGVLIGRNWLSERLDDPDDFVALEITSALKRSISVIPVLLTTPACSPQRNCRSA